MLHSVRSSLLRCITLKYFPKINACKFTTGIRYFNQAGPSQQIKTQLDYQSLPNNINLDSDSFEENDVLTDSDSDSEETGNAGATENDLKHFESSLDENVKKFFKNIKYEYELWKFADPCIPDELNIKHWVTLLSLESSIGRLKYLTKLYNSKKDKLKLKASRKRTVSNRKEMRAKEREDNPEHLVYQLGQNSFFQRYRKSALLKKYNYRLFYSYLHGPNIVYDMSYLKLLAHQERTLTFNQINRAVNTNRLHRAPANLILSDLDVSSEWSPIYDSYFTHFKDHPVTVTTERYCEMFPKDRIIYLSPDAAEILPFVDDEKVYIIGGCVDKCKMRPKASLELSKADGVQSYKLPLDFYLKWDHGHKYLCLDHVMLMLLDMILLNDWYTVLNKHVPSKKLTPTSDKEREIVRKKQQRFRERCEFLINIANETV